MRQTPQGSDRYIVAKNQRCEEIHPSTCSHPGSFGLLRSTIASQHGILIAQNGGTLTATDQGDSNSPLS
jgi:hypothetical protein